MVNRTKQPRDALESVRNVYLHGTVRATTRTGYIVSCNLIGSDAERKHWLDRERTKFQINFSCKKYRMLVGFLQGKSTLVRINLDDFNRPRIRFTDFKMLRAQESFCTSGTQATSAVKRLDLREYLKRPKQ